jgi:hypothetical protein
MVQYTTTLDASIYNTILNAGSRSSPLPSHWAYLPLALSRLIFATHATFAAILP